jgi:hypothetical protein
VSGFDLRQYLSVIWFTSVTVSWSATRPNSEILKSGNGLIAHVTPDSRHQIGPYHPQRTNFGSLAMFAAIR